MKKDLLIAGSLVVLAALGIGIVVVLPFLQEDDTKVKIIKSKPGPLAEMPKKEDPRKPATFARKEADASSEKETPAITTSLEKKREPETKKNAETKVPAKVNPGPKKKEEGPPEPKKFEVKAEPKAEVKVEPKKDEKKGTVAKIIFVGDDLIKLNDPDGEYTVKPMHRGMKIELIGTIKTLKIDGLNERSFLDTSGLVADEIIFTGNLNSGSKVLLGKAKTLRIRDINDQSLLDASALEASAIRLEGAVNGNSTVKLHAVKGSVDFVGEVNDRSQIEIAAPDGKVLFKSRGDSVINGDAKVTILARDVEFGGAINGPQTQVNVTLTQDGSLKFRRVSGGVRLFYSKANAGDPVPRIEPGQIDAGAQFRLMPPGKK